MLTDIEMPRMTGLELAAELARQDRSIRVIVLTTFRPPQRYLCRALDAAAAGYPLKDAPSASRRRSRSAVRVAGGSRTRQTVWTPSPSLSWVHDRFVRCLFRRRLRTDRTAPVDDAGLEKLAVFAGVRDYPARVKCAILAWYTLRAAVGDRHDVVSTE